ncbi:glycosyltransferase involved in cell wall biosynthesis [Neobacillus niacini]|uniref:glycosyltransferase n=1 Tax=Neobacillus niacini TaxID=86668 RepID=UPI00285C64EE|nr:glycosyltransferase [Neobacillus niacini]MDR7078834.1 glycosyltransferase involved in cell wall biosynthesis [Neobacillus niacini]
MNFSVLMSVYFKEKPEFLKESIESLVSQTLKPDEIVIVLDGKLTDELYRLLDEYKNAYPDLFKYVQLEQNMGLGKALEIGIKECRYDVIARMDSDDICHPERFEKQINFLKNNPDVKVLGSWIAEFEEGPDKIESIRKVPSTYEEIREYAKTRCPLNHMTVVYYKEAVLKAGSYQTLMWNEDYFLWGRMLNSNIKFMNIPEALVYARAGADMFNRRGGLKYFNKEVELQKKFLKMQFIDKQTFIKNVITRGTVRILPNSIRGFIYKKLLRR